MPCASMPSWCAMPRTAFHNSWRRMCAASVINAGDGKHEHPTQALLDALTMMRQHKKKLKDLTVVICGDIQHSRVARSNIHLLNKYGAKVRIIAPSYFMSRRMATSSWRSLYSTI